MKIRTDFVTNSSSSSFIVGFTSNDDIAKVVDKKVFNYVSARNYQEIVSKLCSDILNNDNKLTADEVISRVREEAEADAKDSVIDWYQRRTRCSYREALEYAKTPKGKEEVDKYIKERVERVEKRINKFNGDGVFAEVSYGDHTDIGCELEHYILPNCDFTITSFSYH